MLQDRHLFLRPVMHTNVVTHHIAAKDSCIPLAFFFDCQWLNVNGSPMFFLEICFIIIAFLICLCLCSCSYKEKNHRSARSAYAIQALATDLMPQMDRGSSHLTVMQKRWVWSVFHLISPSKKPCRRDRCGQSYFLLHAVSGHVHRGAIIAICKSWRSWREPGKLDGLGL